MKIRKIAQSVVFFVVTIALWCMVPPRNASLNVVLIKLAIQAVTIYLCFFVTANNVQRFCQALQHFGALCIEGIAKVFQLYESAIVHFINWSCEIQEDEADDIGKKIGKSTDYLSDEATRERLRPIRRLMRWIDLTGAVSCATFTIAGVYCCHYQYILAAILLNLLSFTFIYLIAIITDNTAFSKNDYSFCATEPSAGYMSLFIQFIILAVQLIVTIVFKATKTEIVSKSAYDPFFIITLQEGSFTLAPIQAAIIISSVLLLVSYSIVCIHVNQLVRYAKSHDL